MKKILFSSASAILAVVGFSAFKTANTNATTYYWFNVADGSTTATSTTPPTVNNQTATFFQKSQSLSGDGSACSGTGFYCAIGFTAKHVQTSGGVIVLTVPNTSLIAPITAPKASPYTRSSN